MSSAISRGLVGMETLLPVGDVELKLGRKYPVAPSLESEDLSDERFACVVRRGHPAPARPSLEEYAALDHIEVTPAASVGLAMLVGVLLDLEPALRAGPRLAIGVVVRGHRMIADEHVVELPALALVLLHDATPNLRDRELSGAASSLLCHLGGDLEWANARQ